jgi:hypothetical protein
MPDIIDDQELGEREEAAGALAEEDDRLFVDYCIECARESRDSRRDILDAQSLLWDAYQNIMDFGDKEDWQSRVVIPKPFTAVERAVAIIGKAFKNPNYITAEGVEMNDKDISAHVKEGLDFWCSPQKIDFPRKFTNASRMAMAVGLSLEMIPRWENGMLLDWTEPWKICRDPDALPGESQSGMYWIHEEWVDKWKIDEGGKDGYYINTDQVREGGSTTRPEENKEEIERRKKMWWERNTFRKAVLVREFNGVILDRKGNLLLPNAKYTIACDTLIRKPTAIHFVNLKWPGTSFSPIPHILRYDGRGLIEGVFDIWKMLNKMLSLTMDDFSWVVNRMREVIPEMFLDPTDLELYPGKDVYRTADNPKDPCVRDLLTTSSIDKILAVAQYTGTQIDNNDFVSDFVAGLPGTRSNITKGEVEIKTEQNMGIFDLIGSATESGAVNIAYSLFETMILNWNAESRPSPLRVLGDNEFTKFLEGAGLEEKKQFLKEQCDIKIVGISAQLQMAEKAKLLMALKQYAESPLFNRYFKLKELLEETVGALGMYKAPFLKSDDELKDENLGMAIAQALAKVAQSGGPEAQQMIEKFLVSIGINPQQLAGGNGGAGQSMPVPPPGI